MDTPAGTPRSRRLWSVAGLAAVAALVLSACTSGDGAERDGSGSGGAPTARASAPADLAAGQVALDGDTTDVVTGLEAPWSVVLTGDDGDALVSERDSARVLELRSDGTTRQVGTVDGVSHGGEEDCSGSHCTTTTCSCTPRPTTATGSSGTS